MRVRAWNLLILQALREPSATIAVQLFSYLPLYAQAFETELQVAFNAGSSALIPPPGVIADVTHAATGARLWLLLARRRFMTMLELQSDAVLEDMAALYDASPTPQRTLLDDGETNVAEWRAWNELWPALERFARALVQDGAPVANGTLAELAWAQLVDLVHFARVSQSAVAQETASFSALLEQMQSMPLEKSLSSKVCRISLGARLRLTLWLIACAYGNGVQRKPRACSVRCARGADGGPTVDCGESLLGDQYECRTRSRTTAELGRRSEAAGNGNYIGISSHRMDLYSVHWTQ